MTTLSTSPEYRWLDRFTIDPERDIKPFWDCMSATVFKRANDNVCCYHCGGKINQELFRSVARTSITFCHLCNHLSVVYYKGYGMTDPPEGLIFDPNIHDVVMVYQLKMSQIKKLARDWKD